MDKKCAQRLYVHTPYGDHLGIFEPDEKRGFIVTVPGLPGVVTWGKNIAHAKKMAQEAIELCIECKAKEAAQHAPRRLSPSFRRIEESRRMRADLPQKRANLLRHEYYPHTYTEEVARNHT